MRARPRRVRLAVLGVFAGLVCVGGLAMAFNHSATGGEGLLPPSPEKPIRHRAPDRPAAAPERRESELAVRAPGAGRLAGPPASVARRFARDWANRNTVLTPAAKREMVGLSAGAWAGVVYEQAQLTLPAIEGVRAEGGLVMMKLSTPAPQSRTALVVTRERLLGPGGALSAPRYALYLARLDRVGPRGYAITAWEPQL
jgi:hypothetical protein